MEDHAKGKKGIPPLFWAGMLLIIMGVVLGAYVAPYMEGWINPERAEAIQNAQDLAAQNTLLKNQIDCLVNGINLNHGKTTITECT
ncbi:MAG: hypothetical protein V1776_00155 [Candidatus Diapherotrites archaeon]